MKPFRTLQSPCAESISEQPRRGDRRNPSMKTLLRGHRLARRREARRESDAQGYYVDWYAPHTLYLAVSVLLLSCADAMMTLRLLEHGASELNAVMRVLIETDVQLFAAFKMALTGAGLLFLLIHHRFRVFRRFRVEQLLRAVLLLYLLLIGYEFMLLQPTNAPAPALLIVSWAARSGSRACFTEPAQNQRPAFVDFSDVPRARERRAFKALSGPPHRKTPARSRSCVVMRRCVRW